MTHPTELLPTPKYPHLEHFEKVADLVLAAPRIWITEKVHGFNARFGRLRNGSEWFGSRNLVVDPSQNDMQGFVKWAKERASMVPKGVTVFGEWAGNGIQKGLSYGAPDFYLFDVMNELEELQPIEVVDAYAAILNCRKAPLLYDGSPLDITFGELDDMRKAESLLAPGHTREGIVIHPWPAVYDEYGHQLIAKYKAPDFAERAHARKEAPVPADIATVVGFCADYATAERLRHVLDQLREQGVDGLDVRNTGQLLQAFYLDVVREGAEDFNRLLKSEKAQVGKVLNVYVKNLAEEARQEALRAA